MPSPIEITVQQLSRLIGTPGAPALIDVRDDDDFEEDPFLIPASFRYPYLKVTELAAQLKGRSVAIVCKKGLKLSQGAAAMLRTLNINAESLEGGTLAWREAGERMIPASKIPQTEESSGSLWVTRLRPKIDRIACPWLIRRFVDPNARFLFVAPSEVASVADRFCAAPFDIEGVFWSHRGDRCTFDTMIAEFDLATEPLMRLADIVRGADTNRPDIAPQAAGLLAASLGLSRMFRDDLEQLDAGMLLYDAFYRWARDAVDESHNWPATANRN